MQFISWIGAPEFSSARFTAIRSSSPSPAAGRVDSEEPPPETRNSTRSSGPRPRTSASISAAAAAPPASGTGWLAKRTGMRRGEGGSGTSAPWVVTTSPASGTCGQARSTASAIFAAALPTPTTIVRPRGGSGRCPASTVRGSAAASAASNIRRRAARAAASDHAIPALPAFSGGVWRSPARWTI